jgi:putative ABC transport system substrate-binding protein
MSCCNEGPCEDCGIVWSQGFGGYMRRRDFIGLLGNAAAAAWSPAARAQQSPMRTIGFLSSRSPGESEKLLEAFRQGLGEVAFVEGKNVGITYRWAEGRYDRLPTLAAELVGLKVTILVTAGGAPTALAAKAATSTIPVVFTAVSEPVGLGLITSLSRPGGNLTGISALTVALGAKSVEVLKDLLPKSTAMAYLVNPSNPDAEAKAKDAVVAAEQLGVKLHLRSATAEREIDDAFATLADPKVDGLVVPADSMFDSRRNQIVALAARYKLPATYPWRDYVEAGGLMSYGASLKDFYRQAGVYAGRILKGENPADLPVVQPNKFELVINLKTAKALGVTVPLPLLDRADEVIE